jgi:hypothetical protein
LRHKNAPRHFLPKENRPELQKNADARVFSISRVSNVAGKSGPLTFASGRLHGSTASSL